MKGFWYEDLVVEDVQFHVTKARDMVLAANMGLKKKYFAQKIEIASNEAYYLMDDNKKMVAVFRGIPRKKEKKMDSEASLENHDTLFAIQR